MAISQIPYQIYMSLSMMTTRLDDHNFIVWSYQFQTLLEGQNLFGYIDGSTICPPKYVITDDEGVTGEVSTTYKEWKRIDKAILSLLFASLSFDIMDYVVGSKTSREAWMRLSDMYATFSRSQIMQLKTDLYTITKGMDSVEKYLVKVQRVRNQLNALGVTMEDEDIIVIILNGLPADFNLIKAIIRARESSVSIAELRILLLTIERDTDNRATPNIPSSSAMTTKKNASQRCLSGSGNMSENVKASINAFLSSPQCQLTGTSSLHASSNQLQVLLPVHLAKGDSVGNYIGVSPAVVDGGEQNVMDTCSSVNNDSDSYGSINFCGDDSGGVCFGGKIDSSSGSRAEIPYVDHVSNGSKDLYGETNKLTDFFEDKLGGCLVKEDKMDITCAGDNFLNKSVHDETFTYMDCQKQNEQIDHDCLDPYLTVNIGSIVSKEEAGHSKSHHVSETNVGSGTLWDSETVLTKSKGVNELLELSQFKTFEAGAGESVCSFVDGQKVGVQAVNQNQVMTMSIAFFIILLSASKVVHAIGSALFIWFCFLGGYAAMFKDFCHGVSDKKDTGTIDGPAIYGGNVSREGDMGADDNIGAGANVSGNENGINGVVIIGNGGVGNAEITGGSNIGTSVGAAIMNGSTGVKGKAFLLLHKAYTTVIYYFLLKAYFLLKVVFLCLLKAYATEYSPDLQLVQAEGHIQQPMVTIAKSKISKTVCKFRSFTIDDIKNDDYRHGVFMCREQYAKSLIQRAGLDTRACSSPCVSLVQILKI